MLDKDAGAVSRRSLLKTAATAAGAASLGMAGSVAGLPATPAAAAVPAGSVLRNQIYNQPIYYVSTNTATPQHLDMWFNLDFHIRLSQWLQNLYLTNASGWQLPAKIHHVGTYLEPNSYPAHPAARAIDLNSIYFTMGGGLNRIIDFYSGHQAGGDARKRYWAVVAGLSGYFRNTLHYYDGGSHQTHVHVDNWVSGNAATNFSSSSSTQVSMVQACLTYIWGRPVQIDKLWSNGGETDTQSRWVLNNKLGRSGGLTTSQGNWQAFCTFTQINGLGVRKF